MIKLISFSFKICVCAFFVVPLHAEIGKLSEWSKEPHSKCGIRASVSRVRIPHFPQKKKIEALTTSIFFVYHIAYCYLFGFKSACYRYIKLEPNNPIR